MMPEWKEPTHTESEDSEDRAAPTQEPGFPTTAVAIGAVAIIILGLVLVALARRHA